MVEDIETNYEQMQGLQCVKIASRQPCKNSRVPPNHQTATADEVYRLTRAALTILPD